MLISIDIDKAFDQNPTTIHDKNSVNAEERQISQLDKEPLQKHTVNIILNDDKFKASH